MNKVWLIIQREYLTRVRKRSFLIMTVLGPILMAALFIVPVFISHISDKEKLIGVVDESGLFYEKFQNRDNLKFNYLFIDIDTAKKLIGGSGYYAIVYIPLTKPNVPTDGFIFSQSQASLDVKTYIQELMRKEIENLKLEAKGIGKETLEAIKTKINITTIRIDEEGKEKESFTEISMAMGFIAGLLIYFFIFLYGAQVMRGVIEEKTSRIVEVIISSVKPFELMMGKIIGIAMVGLTQFLLWVVLTFSIITVFQLSFPGKFKLQQQQEIYSGSNKIMTPEQIKDHNKGIQDEEQTFNKFLAALNTYNFIHILLLFMFFFLFGYLIYAAFFAAIGSAVDNEADIQQFMLPVTVPLIFSIIMAQFVINSPDGPVSFWLSIIPVTSPIIMMIRVPFGIPGWEVLLSMLILVISFLGATWMAGKIYRTGILLYGKKVSYRELWKWLTYKG